MLTLPGNTAQDRRRSQAFQALAALVLAWLALTASPVFATTYTWNGGGGNVNWLTGGNWGGTAPTSANTTDLIFAGNTNLGTLAIPLNQDIGAPLLTNSITFSAGGGAFFLGGNNIRFDGGASNSITQSSSSAINIADNFENPNTNAPVTITLGGNGTGIVTLSGVIGVGKSGQRDDGIVKNGSSTYALTGNNIYGQGTTINGGTLQINTANSLGTGACTINAGSLEVLNTFTTTRLFTLGNSASTILVDPSQTYTMNGVIDGTGTLNKTGTGTLILGANNTFSGGAVVSAGTLQISASDRLANAGVLTVSGGTFDLQTFNETVGAVSLTSGSITGTGTATLTGSSYAMQSGSVTAILGGTGALTKTTSGTLTLSGANTYSGGTSVNGGTIVLSSSGALGSGGTISFNGGTIQFTSSNTTDYSSRFSTAINQAYSFNTNSQNVTLATALTSSGGTLTKTGSGTLTLTGTNTFNGATTVSGGTLTLAGSSGSALGSTSSITVNGGGTLLLGASNQINNSATMSLGGGGTFAKGNFSEGGTGSVGLGALTLTAGGAHIDFGTGTVGVLSFASLNPAGLTLTIDNWTGNYAQQGGAGTDRLIFDTDQSSNLNNFFFTGYGTGGVEFNLGGGFFEVVAAVPEPSTWVAGGLSAAILAFAHLWRRYRRRAWPVLT